MRASGAALLGVSPGVDAVLEADMMVEHVATMVADLLAQHALPERLGAAAPPTEGWRMASRNARALLSTYTACFREKRGGGPSAQVRRGLLSPAGQAKERPPADSF